MRVGIIGYGLAGRVFHGRLLAATEGARVVAVVTRNPGRQAEARADFPDIALFDNAEQMIMAVPLDLAVVANVNAAHAPTALACLEAGVAVVVDKPLAPTADEGARLVAAAAQTGAALTVFQNRRWDSDQLTLRRLVAEGRLGRVLRYESRFERWRPEPTPGKWREQASAAEGGGLLLDLGSHLVDQAVTLFGPVTSVYAEIAAHRGGADDDVFLALDHATGTRSHLWCGALTAAPGPRLRVLGSAAGLVVDELDGQEDALRTGLPVVPQTGRLIRGDVVAPVSPEPGRWGDFYPAVRDALRAGKPMPVDPVDAVYTLRILDAARVSAAEHRIVTPP
jgi:predicted dehydrogenase